MTQAGGPAAINGFLYQILHHLAWIANIELTGKLAGKDVIDARLKVFFGYRLSDGTIVENSQAIIVDIKE